MILPIDYIEEFPEWMADLRSYLDYYSFDDITILDSPDNYDPAELVILRPVVLKALGKNFRRLASDKGNIIDIISVIRNEYKSIYPRPVKDLLWEEIKIDSSCIDVTAMMNALNEIIDIEIWSGHKLIEDFGLHRTIRKRIIRTLTSDVMKSVKSILVEEKLWGDVADYSAQDLVYIISEVLLALDVKLAKNAGNPCTKCSSKLHCVNNCPIPSISVKAED